MKEKVRKLQKVGNYSYSLIIPSEMIEKYGWRERQKLIIKDRGRGVLEIKDWRSK